MKLPVFSSHTEEEKTFCNDEENFKDFEFSFRTFTKMQKMISEKTKKFEDEKFIGYNEKKVRVALNLIHP